MKIQTSKNKKKFSKKLMLSILLALILIGGSAMYAYTKLSEKNNPIQNSGRSEATDDQIKSGEDIKEGSVNTQTDTSSESNKDAVIDNTDKDTVKVTITSPSAQSGETFIIRSFIDRSVTDGTCSVTLERAGQTSISKSLSGLQPQSNISGCQTFNISTAGLVKGNWQLTVSFTDSASLSGSAKQEITLE